MTFLRQTASRECNEGTPPDLTFPPPRQPLLAALARPGSALLLICLAAPALWPSRASGQTAAPRSLAAPQTRSPANRSKALLARRGLGRAGDPAPAAILLGARAAHAALLQARDSAAATQPSTTVWQPVGPSQVNTAAWGLVTGRITSIAADPSDLSGNTVYLGTTGGGIWKSVNAAGSVSGATFSPLTDTLSAWSSAALTSLSIGAVSVQPGGTSVILAGTGDPNDATDSWYGAGILRSTDGGTTWNLISSTSVAGSGQKFYFLGNAFAGFAWSTASPSLVAAAVTQSEYGALLNAPLPQSLPGLYYSLDAGATWQLATIEDGAQVIQSSQVTVTGGNAATAVVWNAARQRFYAAVRFHGYYESADGITWSRLASQPGVNLTVDLCPPNPGAPGSPACPLFRGALAVQPATGDMFALTVDLNNFDQGLWQDVCGLSPATGACTSGAVQFGTRIADQPLQSLSGDTTIPQGAYNLWLAAVPSQQDTLLLAGTADIWRCSLANSCVWRNTTNALTCAAAHVAPAQHAVDTTFGAAGLLYFGNDGGLWRSTDSIGQQAAVCSADDANHFQNLNGALGSLAEVENFSQDPNDPSTLLAALGGLGTAAPSGNAAAWNQVLDGEGDVVAIDPANPQDWYATSLAGIGVNRCSEGTACDTSGFGTIAIGESQVDNDLQLIPPPWILDPAGAADLILGTCRVWRGPATGLGWNQSSLLSNILDGTAPAPCNSVVMNAEIRSLAAAVVASGPSGSELLYAGMAGSLDGGGLAAGHLFTAAVNPASQASTTAWSDRYASPVSNNGTVTQFNPGAFDISSLYADPHDPAGQTIYLTVQGFSSGSVQEALVYRSTDAGAHWANITANLPNAPANSIVVDPNDANILYIATDTGVYITQNVTLCLTSGSVCWNVFGSGLPNAPVTSLMTYNQGSVQELRAATYGRGIWETALATAGISTTASADPASLTFAPQQVQTASASQTVIVHNSGPPNLTIGMIGISGDFGETDTCGGQSVAAGADCRLQIFFDPSQTGSRQGTLTLFGNVAGGQLTVSLSGTGLTAAAVVFAPSSLAFAAAQVGTTSATQYLTVSNTGASLVSLAAESLSGDFIALSNTCGTSLAAGTGCTLGIAFRPTASGSRSGALSVTDSLGTQTAQLTGTGQTTAADSLSPVSLSFSPQEIGTASAAGQVTLTNTGDQALTGISVTVTGDFTAVNNCGSLLQGHGACTIPVAYVPTRTGAESGTLSVTDEFRSQSVALSGAGIAPPGVSATPAAIDFGGYAVASTSGAQIVTVTNNNGSDLTGLSATVTPGFAIASNNCPAVLAIGGACQIGLTFSPPALGPATGILSVTGANLPRPLTVRLSGSGEDFTLAFTGSSSAVLTSGQTATFALQLAGLSGTTGTVALTCSGAPGNTTCSLNPAGLVLSGLNTSSATVTIVTGTAASSAAQIHPNWKTAVAVLCLLLPLGWAGPRFRMRAGALVLLLALALLPAGCGTSASSGAPGSSGSGGSGTGQNSTPSGTYVVTVTGAMSNISHSVTLSLTVE